MIASVPALGVYVVVPLARTTTFDAVPATAWNVGALAPFEVRTWPAVPFPTWLKTPLVLYTRPVVKPLNVIVPDEVRPVRLVSVPAIVLLPVTVMPPAPARLLPLPD